MSIEFSPAFDTVHPSPCRRPCAPSELGSPPRAHATECERRRNARPAPPRRIASPRRLAANRRNALRSTGPRTAAGKQRSSRNALKHGLCASSAVRLPGECEAAYETFAAELRADLSPRTAIDEHLFQQLTTLLWRLRRLPAAQAELFDAELRFAADGETLSPAQVIARRFSDEPARNGFLLLDRYERGMLGHVLSLLAHFNRDRRQRTRADRSRDAAAEFTGPPAWNERKAAAQREWFATPDGQAELRRVRDAASRATSKTNPIEPTAKSEIPRPAKKSSRKPRTAGAKRTQSPARAAACGKAACTPSSVARVFNPCSAMKSRVEKPCYVKSIPRAGATRASDSNPTSSRSGRAGGYRS
jgi:hypothetical protein